ncbi:hypothetical protein OC834_007845, partial [Tilletia horrida]
MVPPRRVLLFGYSTSALYVSTWRKDKAPLRHGDGPIPLAEAMSSRCWIALPPMFDVDEQGLLSSGMIEIDALVYAELGEGGRSIQLI